MENSDLSSRLHEALYLNKGLEYKARDATNLLAEKEKDYVERAQHYWKINLNMEASTSEHKRTKNLLAAANDRLARWREKWYDSSASRKKKEDEMKAENEELKKKLKIQDELLKAHAQRRSYREDLEKSQKQLDDAKEELEELRVRAGVKKSKVGSTYKEDNDEVLLMHMDSLSEALDKRDVLISGLIERPDHPSTKALFEEVKRHNEKLKDLKFQD